MRWNSIFEICSPAIALNAGFQSVSQLRDGSTPHSGPIQLASAGSVGFVSPRTVLCGPTHVLKILGDAEFLADLQTTQESGGLGREGLIRNCNVTDTKMKSLLKCKCSKKLIHLICHVWQIESSLYSLILPLDV